MSAYWPSLVQVFRRQAIVERLCRSLLTCLEPVKLLDLVDLRETAGGRSKRLLPRDMDVPRQVVRSSGIRANFMCDNSSYLFGVEKKKNKPVEITEDKFNEMKLLHESILEGIDDPGAMAVLSFASTWNPKQAEEHPVLSPLWDELMSGGNIVFKLDGTDGFIHQRPAIRKRGNAE